MQQAFCIRSPFLFLLLFACFASCTKKDFPHKNSTIADTSKTDSIAKLDSLPSFNGPAGIAVDVAGNIYVADYGNNLIRKITAGGLVSTVAGNGFQGSLNGTAAASSFNKPSSLVVDASGNIYITDSGNNRIREITAAGMVSTIAGADSAGYINASDTSALFFDPLGITRDGAGNLYVADAGNNVIRLITPGAVVSTFAGATDSLTSNGTPSPSIFDNPTGIAMDGTGNLVVANYLNNNILKVSSAGLVSLIAGSQQLQGSANGPDSAATFYLPNSVAVDAANNIYVADGVNNLIRKISAGGTVSTFAGSGSAGSADSTGTAASFNGPGGLAFDASGNLYVADTNNNLIRKISPLGVVTTVAGSGLPGAKNGQVTALRRRAASRHIKAMHFSIWAKPRKPAGYLLRR